MELNILDINGKKTSKKVKLNKEIFGIEPNDHAIYLDVKLYLANQRRGTHKSKQKAEIHFSTKKLRKQKGGGGARIGSRKSPLLRGGGRVFGPQPRDYEFKLNKKLKRLARKSALSYKAKDKNITVLEEFKMDKPRTKDYVAILKNLELNDKKTLLITADSDKNILLASRNLKKAKVINASQINTYEIMNADKILLVANSVKSIESQFNLNTQE